jgi:hypothetical protein
MTRSTHILNELQSISPAVANLGTQMPYTVPAGYFETLSDVIIARIIAGSGEGSAVMSVTGKAVPFEVPAGYFENLSATILSKVKMQTEVSAVEELKELSPVLAAISKQNVYTVPDGYFDAVPALIADKTTDAGKAKIISIGTIRKWTSYAAAAAVFIMIAFGLNRIINSNPSSPVLEGYVQEGLNYKTEAQIAEGLQSIGEADLVSYLQTTAESKDAEIIASLVNEDDLQSEEKTVVEDPLLESYMNQLNETETTTQNN